MSFIPMGGDKMRSYYGIIRARNICFKVDCNSFILCYSFFVIYHILTYWGRIFFGGGGLGRRFHVIILLKISGYHHKDGECWSKLSLDHIYYFDEIITLLLSLCIEPSQCEHLLISSLIIDDDRKSYRQLLWKCSQFKILFVILFFLCVIRM